MPGFSSIAKRHSRRRAGFIRSGRRRHAAIQMAMAVMNSIAAHANRNRPTLGPVSQMATAASNRPAGVIAPIKTVSSNRSSARMIP